MHSELSTKIRTSERGWVPDMKKPPCLNFAKEVLKVKKTFTCIIFPCRHYPDRSKGRDKIPSQPDLAPPMLFYFRIGWQNCQDVAVWGIGSFAREGLYLIVLICLRGGL